MNYTSSTAKRNREDFPDDDGSSGGVDEGSDREVSDGGRSDDDDQDEESRYINVARSQDHKAIWRTG